MAMKVIPPIEITDAMVLANSIVEPDPGVAVWSAATNYAIGTVVARLGTHRLYEALQAGVDSSLPEEAPDRWLDLGPTNAWAAFDLLRSTASIGASPASFTVKPGRRFNGLFLGGVVADEVEIDVSVSGVSQYAETVPMYLRAPTNWYEYFFDEFRSVPSLVRFDLPPVLDAEITITLNRSAGDTELGAFVIGQSSDIGTVLSGSQAGALNFSTIARNFDGSAILTQRRSVPKTTSTIWADKNRVPRLLELRRDLNAMPAVWSALEADDQAFFEAFLILGVYKEFTITAAEATHVTMQLELEEI
jgi:hypothetical protein